jgi:hypothetical protein
VPAQKRRRVTFDMEEMLGGNWLGKLGVIVLVMGVVFWLAYTLPSLAPMYKVLLGYLTGLGMLGAGVLAERRDRYRILARGAIGGGWALVFFVTFAMHFLEAARVIESAAAVLLLMLLVAVAMVSHTLRYNSQLVTGMAFLLGFLTVAMASGSIPGVVSKPNTVYSLGSGAILAAGLVAITRRRNWFELEVFGLLASYLNHYFWLRPILEPMGETRHAFPEFAASTTLLLLYWAAFRWSYIFRNVETDAEERVSAVAALLNTSLLIAILRYQSVQSGLAFYVLLVLGLVEMTIAWVPAARRRRPAFVLLTTIGSLLLIAAIPFKFSGLNLAVLWLAEAQVLMLAGVFLRESLFRRFAVLAAALASGHLVVHDAGQIWMQRSASAATDAPQLGLAVAFAFAVLLFYLDAHWLPRRWRDLFTSAFERKCMQGLSYAGGALALIGAWLAFPNHWTAVAWAALALALAFAGRRLHIAELSAQAHLLAASAFAACLLTHTGLEGQALGISLRLLTMSLVAGTLYLTARWCGLPEGDQARATSMAYTTAASLLVTVLVFQECPEPWVPVAWLAFGLVLALVGLRWHRAELCIHTHVLSAIALLLLLSKNASMGGALAASGWLDGVSLRLVTLASGAALSYLLAHWCGPRDAGWTRAISMAYTTAGTGLAALLIFLEFTQTHWIAVAWAAFALLLVVLGRWLKRAELPWQGHVLSLLALVSAVFISLQASGPSVGVLSQRLVTVSLVAALFYVSSRLAGRLQFEWATETGIAYSWAGSLLVSLLLWYELRPINVALGWAIFGLLLFELGFGRKSVSLRVQGYLAMASAFARIFYVNLNADGLPGEISPRLFTTLPLAALFFYVYSRFDTGRDQHLAADQRLRAPAALCYFGTITLAALLRFEVIGDWVVAAWAGLVLVLLAAAQWTKRDTFLYQGYLLTFAIVFRTLLHNFAVPRDVIHTTATGTAVTLLFLGLGLAFPLRRRLAEEDPGNRGRLATALARPEQVFFFVPLLLLLVLQALVSQHGVTMAWGLTGLAVFIAALWLGQRSFRLAGLGLLLLCVAKLGLVDTWRMSSGDRYLTFIFIGTTMVLVSFLYNRFREKIRGYL